MFCILIAALVNDTVGTLLAHSYTHPNTFVGAIFGTGTNGAYVEDACNIHSVSSDAKEMLVNIEWGNFDKDKEFLPLTIHDNKLDRESIVSSLSSIFLHSSSSHRAKSRHFVSIIERWYPRV